MDHSHREALNPAAAEPRVFGLDLLRASAIALVLLAHASFMFLPRTHALEGWWMLGHLGVELFFVLSGFLIGGILVRQARAARFAVGRFWVRRWLRTLPNYYLFLVINILLARWIDGDWPAATRYVFFAQNFAWPQPIFFIESWSLAVEEIFYLIAPLLVLVFAPRGAQRISPLLWVALAIAVATGVRIGYVLLLQPPWDLAVRMVALVRMDAIGYGVLAVLLYNHAGGFARRHARAIAGIGALGLAIAIALYFGLPRDTDLFARTGLFSLISLSFAALLPAAANWQRSAAPAVFDGAVRRLALWSYALYLCQLAVMRVMDATFAGHAQTFAGCLLQALMFMALSITCAALVYRYFERPILQWRDRVTRKPPGADAGAQVKPV